MIKSYVLLIIFYFAALSFGAAVAKDGVAEKNFVPVLKLKDTKPNKQEHYSPDRTQYLHIDHKNATTVVVTATDNNQIIKSDTDANPGAAVFIFTTGLMWLPKHGHLLVESSDQGTAEYRLGLLDNDDHYHELNPLKSAKNNLFVDGYYVLYGASADGKSIVYGYSSQYTEKPLKRRYYRLPPELLKG